MLVQSFNSCIIKAWWESTFSRMNERYTFIANERISLSPSLNIRFYSICKCTMYVYADAVVVYISTRLFVYAEKHLWKLFKSVTHALRGWIKNRKNCIKLILYQLKCTLSVDFTLRKYFFVLYFWWWFKLYFREKCFL